MNNLDNNKIGNEGAKHLSKMEWKHMLRFSLSMNHFIETVTI